MRFRYNLVKPTSAFDERASASMHRHTPIKVRYGETDMMGVVYHANYLLYFEDARIDFLDAVGFSYNECIEQQGYMSPIHDVEMHYRAPLRYGEAGFVRTSVAKNLPMRTVTASRSSAPMMRRAPTRPASRFCARAPPRSWTRSSPCASWSAAPSSPSACAVPSPSCTPSTRRSRKRRKGYCRESKCS